MSKSFIRGKIFSKSCVLAGGRLFSFAFLGMNEHFYSGRKFSKGHVLARGDDCVLHFCHL